MAIVNLPPAKLTMRPFRMLPSFNRMVSAKATTDIVRMSAADIAVLIDLELNDIFSPAVASFDPFLIAYGTLRFSMPTWPVPDFVFSGLPGGIEHQPLIFVTIMTFVLIVSSVTMVRAVQEGHRENKKGIIFWMFLTILGGLSFLGSQAREWTTKIKGAKNR